MGLYDVPMVMSFLGFGSGMMLASFHICGMMLLFCDMFIQLILIEAQYIKTRLLCILPEYRYVH